MLSKFFKLLEKIIYSRTAAFFDKRSILLFTQYGFRPNHSTSQAWLDVVTSAIHNINNNKNTALLLVD